MFNANDYSPFVVGVFRGQGKPKCIVEFLRPFISEMKELEKDGIEHGDERLPVDLTAIVCDVPARSFVKCTKGHAGYNPCGRCTQKGERYEGRIIFSLVPKFVLRSDETRRNNDDAGHHNSKSPLCDLSVEMVFTFPVDYLRGVCLGVVKRRLCIWNIRSLAFKLGNHQRRLLTEILRKLCANLRISEASSWASKS